MISSLIPPQAAGTRMRAPEAPSTEIQSRYLYSEGEHELSLCALEVSDRQAKAVREGTAEFALLVDEPLILVCSRFGDDIPWMVSPYCWHLVPKEARTLPPLPNSPDERRVFLAVSLSAMEDGSIRATRNVTLSLDFTRALNEAIREQAKLMFNSHAHRRALQTMMRRYPTAASLAARASIRSIGSA